MRRSIDELNFTWQMPANPRQFPIVMIGAGAITDTAHLPAYKLANFEIQGIFDVDHQKAQAMADKWGITQVFNTLSEACTVTNDSAKQVIFDLAIPPTHIMPVLKELPENSHVLMQKPMGETGLEARSIVELCKQRQLHASVNFQLRYAPNILALKDAIRRGWLGDRLTTIEIHVNALMPWSSWPFLAHSPRIEPSNHSVHYVDLVRDLLAPHEPHSIHGHTCKHASTPQLSPVRTNISLAFEHDPYLYVNIYTNHAHRWGAKHAESYLLVEGTKGAAKAQISDNLAFVGVINGGCNDYLQVRRQLDERFRSFDLPLRII
jgi:predicted dehydrogenase